MEITPLDPSACYPYQKVSDTHLSIGGKVIVSLHCRETRWMLRSWNSSVFGLKKLH
jgi:hypothetical protein